MIEHYKRETYQSKERLSAGIQIRYTLGQFTQYGVTVALDDTDYSLYPDGHPWACPDYATPVKFEGREKATWVRTCCLEIIAEPQTLLL